MSKPEDHQELDDLALRVLHGVADEAEQAALQELLRTKPAGRHRFILQATQHAMLCREGAAGSLADDKRLYFERLEEDGQLRWWAGKAWLAAAAVAATLLVASLLLRPTDAMAALERVVQVAQETVTRCYSVRVLEVGPPEAPAEGRGPYPPANHLEGATLWMKGPGEFVLRQGLPNGEIRLFGGDRSGSWTMRGLGPVKVSPDPTRFGRAIFAPSGDQSASTRVAVWEWTLDYVAHKPFGGGFDAYRSNRFNYVMPVKQVNGNTTTVTYSQVEDKGRAFHSSIFELLGEQGWPGLIIWLALHGLGLWQMERIYRRWKGATDETEAWISPLAAALEMGALIYLVGALFQGIGYQPVMLMLVGLQIGLATYCARIDSVRAGRDRSRKRREAITTKMGGAVAA